MNGKGLSAAKEARWRTISILIVLALLGLLLIVASEPLRFLYHGVFLPDLLRELGIVLLAVFSVSLIYETALAEKYLEQFRALLRSELEQSNSNAAICAQLGIVRIFLTRDEFTGEYPLKAVLSRSDAKSKIRVVGVTLFHLLNQAEDLKYALYMGADIQLCLLNPAAATLGPKGLTDLYSEDIDVSLTQFKRQIAESVRNSPPIGRIELRVHDFSQFHSYSVFTVGNQELGIWDLSFGRHTKDKRIFLVNPFGPLGTDLAKRFDPIWDAGKPIFLFEDKQVKLDELAETHGHVKRNQSFPK